MNDAASSDSVLVLPSKIELSADQFKAIMDEIASLKSQINELQESNLLRCREIAQDRQRLAKLETKQLRPEQRKKSEILIALINSRNGKMPAKEARQLMSMSKQSFTNLLAGLKDEIEVKQFKTDRRKKLLVIK